MGYIGNKIQTQRHETDEIIDYLRSNQDPASKEAALNEITQLLISIYMAHQAAVDAHFAVIDDAASQSGTCINYEARHHVLETFNRGTRGFINELISAASIRSPLPTNQLESLRGLDRMFECVYILLLEKGQFSTTPEEMDDQSRVVELINACNNNQPSSIVDTMFIQLLGDNRCSLSNKHQARIVYYAWDHHTVRPLDQRIAELKQAIEDLAFMRKNVLPNWKQKLTTLGSDAEAALNKLKKQ